MTAAHADRIARLARQFANYLASQTDVEIIEMDQIGAAGTTGGPDALLLTAFERLDAALAQLADLASVYSDDRPSSLEPLALPSAALAGEYLRAATGANWFEPDPNDPAADESVSLLLPGTEPMGVDLFGVARNELLSGKPNLRAVAARLIEAA